MNTTVNGFRYRWFVENCSQIELPNGKVIVIDPIFWKDDSQCANDAQKKFISGFDDSVIERCDYILLTHIHFDHTASLKALVDRFNAPVLVNGWSAFELVNHLDLPAGCVIPMTDGCEYNFDDFKVLWQQCRHTLGVGRFRPSETPFKDMPKDEQIFGNMGTTYNSDFIIKLPNGMSISMDGGAFEPHLLELEKHHPTLILRHVERDVDLCAAQIAEALKRSESPFVYILTIHLIQDKEGFVNTINEKLAAEGISGRVVYAKAGQWLSFGSTAAVE